MNKFYGFDLGDAESAVSLLEKDRDREPRILPVGGAASFITAWARLSSRNMVIGENACYHPDAVERHLRFKSSFLTDPASAGHITSFASGVLGELYEAGSVIKGEDSCFYIGCPAGWGKHDRERYRSIFTRLGYPPVKIISESRAALVSAWLDGCSLTDSARAAAAAAAIAVEGEETGNPAMSRKEIQRKLSEYPSEKS